MNHSPLALCLARISFNYLQTALLLPYRISSQLGHCAGSGIRQCPKSRKFILPDTDIKRTTHPFRCSPRLSRKRFHLAKRAQTDSRRVMRLFVQLPVCALNGFSRTFVKSTASFFYEPRSGSLLSYLYRPAYRQTEFPIVSPFALSSVSAPYPLHNAQHATCDTVRLIDI